MQYYSLLYHFLLDPCAHGIACLLVAYLVAPTQFIKVMYQETGEPYGSIINRYLCSGNFKIFFSGAHVYAVRQFISSVAFGLSQWLFFCLLAVWPITYFIGLVFWQCFFNGVIETIVTVHSEIREIAMNKGSLVKSKLAIKDVAFSLLIRNTLSGIAPILSYEITKHREDVYVNVLVSALVGIVVSVIAVPFDLIVTQNCGAAIPMTWLERLKYNMRMGKSFFSIFNGLAMRILQMVPFSIAHGLVMLFLKRFTRL